MALLTPQEHRPRPTLGQADRERGATDAVDRRADRQRKVEPSGGRFLMEECEAISVAKW